MTAITHKEDTSIRHEISRHQATDKLVNECGNTATRTLVELTIIPYDGTESTAVVMHAENEFSVSKEWHNRPA